MAKKASPDSAPARGLHDVVGIVLMGCALLLLVALLSYNPTDVSANAVSTNHHAVSNWIGPFGAWMAYYWLFWVGVPAFLVPFIMVFVGLGCFFAPLAYLRR